MGGTLAAAAVAGGSSARGLRDARYLLLMMSSVSAVMLYVCMVQLYALALQLVAAVRQWQHVCVCHSVRVAVT